jgi:putative transposase
MSALAELQVYRNRLPHWRLAGSIYFVTWALKDRVTTLNNGEVELVANALEYFHLKRYRLFGYCVMDDHVHVLLEPFEGYGLEQILHSLKSFTAHEINRRRGTTGAVWQKASYDRIMRDEAEVLEKLQYMLNNPLERWGIHDYEWAKWFPWH